MTLTPAQIREERIRQEREYYLDPANLLDFISDSGAAPDAQEFPHGKGLRDACNWTFTTDERGRRIYKGKIFLWPRGSFKSQALNVGFAAWLIACDPNIRIPICSETGRQARKFVANVMRIVDSAWFREKFGVHKGEDWNRYGFTSALRTATHLKEPTLAGFGVGEVQTGAHWDFAFIDDAISQENTKTPDAIETTNEWFGEIMAQLDPGSRLFVIGTHHHHADWYTKAKKELRSLFEISSHSWKNPDGTLFFPERLTEQFVMNQKLVMTPRMFSCYYENQPISDSERCFKPEYFRTIRDEDVPRAVWTFILTDFAFQTSQQNDRTCFWVVSLDTNRVAYVRDVIIGRFKPSDSVKLLVETWNRYLSLDMKAITVELATHEEMIKGLIEEIRRDTFVRPRLVTIPGRSQEVKDMRIESAETRFRRGDIYFCESFREGNPKAWNLMFHEMTEWPFSAHDDVADAISDLDKRDANNRFICPGPPAGWSPFAAKRHVPSLIDGKFNKAMPVDPREMLRKLGQRQSDVWQQTGSPGRAAQADVFGQHAKSPSPLKPF